MQQAAGRIHLLSSTSKRLWLLKSVYILCFTCAVLCCDACALSCAGTAQPLRYCGYEVTTEGDSFTIAFHDAFDAVCWSLAMQQAMLEAGECGWGCCWVVLMVVLCSGHVHMCICHVLSSGKKALAGWVPASRPHCPCTFLSSTATQMRHDMTMYLASPPSATWGPCCVLTEWPDQLLTHDKAGVVYSTGKDSSRPGHLLFRGLRVRVAISTGGPGQGWSRGRGVD
jgi:hypothetical protein